MKLTIVTLFPDFFISPFNSSILGRAIREKKVEIEIVNPRNFAPRPHRKVDDYPYGGGAGLVLRVDVMDSALKEVRSRNQGPIIALGPGGAVLTQQKLVSLSKLEAFTLVCGHYEGFDERIYDFVDEEISVGDYVLTGGEPAALTIIDGVVRLIEGVLGNPDSPLYESFSNRRIEAPVYTRPFKYRGKKVPSVLLSGNHKKIERYNQKMSLMTTLKKRPDLLVDGLTKDELELLEDDDG
jgi:tRNA (guanine37-N1)-methyltransferase